MLCAEEWISLNICYRNIKINLLFLYRWQFLANAGSVVWIKDFKVLRLNSRLRSASLMWFAIVSGHLRFRLPTGLLLITLSSYVLLIAMNRLQVFRVILRVPVPNYAAFTEFSNYLIFAFTLHAMLIIFGSLCCD